MSPLFHRTPSSSIPQHGPFHCTQYGCTATDAAQCTYVDREGNACASAWCPAHQVLAHGSAFCRRHANTVLALSPEHPVPSWQLPAVDDRMPSLIHWIAQSISPDVRRSLSGHHLFHDHIESTPVLHVREGDGHFHWEKSWTAHHSHGTSTAVVLSVRDDRPTTLVCRVQDEVVYRSVPPWISVEEGGSSVGSDIAPDLRAAFHTTIVGAVGAASSH